MDDHARSAALNREMCHHEHVSEFSRYLKHHFIVFCKWQIAVADDGAFMNKEADWAAMAISASPMTTAIAKRFVELPFEYLEWSQKCAAEYALPVVLKTDAYNEQWDHLPLPGGIAGNLKGAGAVHIVELNPRIAECAMRLNASLTIHIGDIRELPFENGFFDVVLDLSTLDHVPPRDTGRVLKEYRRVMRVGATLLLYVWCSEVPDTVDGGETLQEDGQRQYMLHYPVVRDALESLFEVEHSEPALRDGDCVLHRFVAKRGERGAMMPSGSRRA